MKCFVYGFRGIIYTIKNERNMRIHLCFAFYVIIAGFITQIALSQWLAVLICIALVCGAECLNTAVEVACNALHPARSAQIGLVKDLAAGSVLTFAIGAAIVGSIIFFREDKVNKALEFAINHPIVAAVIMLCLPVWIYCIFYNTKVKSER